jgi:hypothetical protein
MVNCLINDADGNNFLHIGVYEETINYSTVMAVKATRSSNYSMYAIQFNPAEKWQDGFRIHRPLLNCYPYQQYVNINVAVNVSISHKD